MILFAAAILAAFVLGSLPTGFLIAKARGIDIRTVGSGNIGATNVTRTLGKKLGALVFILDVLKGSVPVLLARSAWPQGVPPLEPSATCFLVGTGAIFGHCLSPFLGFKGGKGVATAFGVVLATAPLTAISCIGLFFVVIAVTRLVSLASIVGVSSCFLFALVYGDARLALAAIPAVGLVVSRHAPNIKRLLDGTESKFGKKKE